MLLILDEKWLRRILLLTGFGVLMYLRFADTCPAGYLFGALNALLLCAFAARLVWVIRHRRRILLKLARETPGTARRRSRFYSIAWIVWFLALLGISGPIGWKFWVACGFALLLIAGHLVPAEDRRQGR